MGHHIAQDRYDALKKLAELDGNISATAREMKVSPALLRRWQSELQDPGVTLDRIAGNLALDAERLSAKLLSDDETAPLNQRASALGMLVDRLLKLEDRRRALTPDAIENDGETVVRVEYADGAWGGDDADDDD